MHRIGRLHFKGQMWALGVVYLHCLRHHLPGLSQVPWAMKQKLAFEDPVDAFGHRVLVAVVAVGH